MEMTLREWCNILRRAGKLAALVSLATFLCIVAVLLFTQNGWIALAVTPLCVFVSLTLGLIDVARHGMP
jgi:hypothetical protein